MISGDGDHKWRSRTGRLSLPSRRTEPFSQERQELNQALREIVLALGKLKAVAPDMVVYLNGSFVTRKPSPNDLDMLILTDHLDEDQLKAFLQHEAPIASLTLDLYAEHLTGGASARIIAVFAFTRTNRPKGLIILDF
jgi:predicted nucleotidyltransferase